MDIQPIPFKLVTGSDAHTRLCRYLREKVISQREGLRKLHGLDGVVKWRKCYEAIPSEEVREFPWHGASNLIVPIVGIHTDTLLARVMAAVMKTRPIWTSRLFGEFAEIAPPDLRDTFEEFMGYEALEPSELDLYRVERDWFMDTISLGTGVLKAPWMKSVIDEAVTGDGSSRISYVSKTLYDGPRPEKVRYEDFKYPVNVPTVEAMNFKYHIVRLERFDLEERKFHKIYDPDAVNVVLQSPDRTSPDLADSEKQRDAKAQVIPGYGFAEWDICECHFKYRLGDKLVKLIVNYHERTNTILRSYYYYYPDEIFIAARLFYRCDMFPGMGMAEVLAALQEEDSEIHNQRRDNATVANMKMYRVDPDSTLNKGYKIYPGAMLPAKQGEIEPFEFGVPVQGEIDSERMTLELADKRSGVSPPMQGAGAGSNTKRGIYTAMGTLSIMQEGNTRTDLNITDIRYAHTKLGRLVAREFAHFGLGDRLRLWGKKGQMILQALEAVKDGTLALPIYASTASVNREVEKQNDLMLSNVSERYHQSITQMLTAASNPMIPENVKNYIQKAIYAANILMQSVYRHFGYDEVDRLAPKPELEAPKPPAPPMQPQQQQMQQPQGQPIQMPQGPQMPQMPPGMLQ